MLDQAVQFLYGFMESQLKFSYNDNKNNISKELNLLPAMT